MSDQSKRTGMHAKTYIVFGEAVERGIERGWKLAHRHEGAPGEETIKARIEECVLHEVCERFTFDE